jgi:hypothetical protein
MKRLPRACKAYLNNMDYLNIFLVKSCLCALGALIGLHVSENKRGAARRVASLVFWATSLPLLGGFLRQLVKKPKEEMIELHFVAKEKDLKDNRK